MQYNAVLFDLDGTLLDTLADIADAVNRALAGLGFPQHPREAYKRFVGEGIAVLARRVLPAGNQNDEDVRACLTAINREYGRGLLVKTRPYDGVIDLLHALAKRKIPLAIVSNKPHDLALRSVALFKGVSFGAIYGERKGVPAKPDPAAAFEAASVLGVPPAECLYVGDSGIDMKTATRAGMFAVGALWGFRDRKELTDCGAKALIEHPLGLLKLFEEK
jgi:phosphoglycolate phosphatase